MIISKTPFRISLFGGGTDYPNWYRENGGSVLATAIDKYCYISCRHLPPFFEHKHRIVYSKVENVKEIKEIQHPSVRAVLSTLETNAGLEIHHNGDLPARSGIGSSSSFTVGLINVINALKGQQISKEDLAKQAIYIEQKVLKESVGSQDQILASFGGFNRINFYPDDTFNITPVIISKSLTDQLQSHMLLFFTGVSRFSSDIAKDKIANFKNRFQELTQIKQMVDEGLSILQSPSTPIAELGKLLHESWQLKRSLSNKVSTPEIDTIYQTGLAAGAIGGKILGAGGGGFILFFAKPENHKNIRKKLKGLVQVSFCFDNTGSKIVLYEPNGFK
jgi:D-glycero-alpha-D-manno-heptose-7-phosphate kinase|tara:strand:- start:151 stop:1149 length:999 start_codon:yes stop_codon:yes gene_type:complete